MKTISFTISEESISFSYHLDQMGLLHHDSEPSLLIKDSDSEWSFYFHHGILYRDKAPALSIVKENSLTVYYHENYLLNPLYSLVSEKNLLEISRLMDYETFLISRHFLNNSFHHRDNGPAYLHDSKYEQHQHYFKNGELHRDDGPAMINYHRTKEKESTLQFWYLEGLFISEGEKNDRV